jgi:hypothetical protein
MFKRKQTIKMKEMEKDGIKIILGRTMWKLEEDRISADQLLTSQGFCSSK